MTGKTHKPAAGKRRLLIASLLGIVLCAGAWITYFLVNLDLNDYRQQAEERLSSLLSLSVSIGEIKYNLHDSNLALHINGLQIGDQNSILEIKSPDLMIDLQWRGLLQRDFRFSSISLKNPEVWIRRTVVHQAEPPAPQAVPTPVLIDQALLYSISVDALEFTNGLVHIESISQGQPTERIKIRNIEGEIREIRLDNMSKLAIKGELLLPGQKLSSRWQLRGGASLFIDPARGLTPKIDLDLESKALDLAAIRSLFEGFETMSLSGLANLDLHLKGSPAEQIDFQMGLSSKSLGLLPNNTYSTPIGIENLVATGQLLTDSHRTRVNNLSVQIDESRVSGQLEWSADPGPLKVTADLANSKFTVAQIKQWLPDLEEDWLSYEKQLGAQGSVLLQTAKLTYDQGKDRQQRWQIDLIKGELQRIAWQFQNAPPLEITLLPFNLNKEEWQIDNSQWQMGSMEININGYGEYDFDQVLVKSLTFDGDILPERLLGDWYIPQGALTTEGKIAISGRLEGPHDQLAIDLQADLSHLELNHPAGLRLSPGKDDKLAIHATVSPEKISLDHGSVKWSAAKGHISGSYLPGTPDSLEIDALLSINDLTRIADSLPLLEKLAIHGQADLSIKQRGQPGSNRPEMTLTLRDAGLRATRFIADLSNINGRVKVEPAGLHAENIRVQLGESLLTVNADLNDFTDPRLSLDVKGAAVRANDIIFHSDKAMLRDIDGHLEINRNGLTFAPVDVRLDGGTDASVQGTISFQKPYAIDLDITSRFALISEVVGLWTDRSSPARGTNITTGSEPERQRQMVPITINADVKRGDLYGMNFHDATGVISPTRERLVIHPLDFSVGEGYCNAQVLTYFTKEAPPLLLISGHAEDVDALEVYRELLNQKSIVRGKLRGDFYLHGEIGSHYLNSSYGRFNVQIRDGVMHQFPILSKVFSLLNVSQIFALQLPDMDLEGMPFDELAGNFRLDKGILISNDLVIKSEAMNQAYNGQLDIINKEINLTTAIHPLGTVDKIVSRIPIAGWLLTGEDKALLTAHFTVKGKTDDVSVQPMPLDTITEPTIGLLKRTLGLPFKLIEDPQILWGGEGKSETGKE